MLATKSFALRRSGMWETIGAGPHARPGLIVCGMLLLTVAGSPAQAQRLTLPPEEQAAVNRAIDDGVTFLKATQSLTGSWAADPKAAHQVGYAALPALTLLECGVPANDPLIQRARALVRARAADLDGTYELSLAVLFLDRLGDPRDKKFIQTFALRLIAGQTATGGWGYKCPGPKLLDARTQMDLLTALRQLPPYPADAMAGIITGSSDSPGLSGGSSDSPGELKPTAPAPAGSPQGTTADAGASRSPGESVDGPSLWRTWLGFSTEIRKELHPEPIDKKLVKDRPADAPPPAPAANPRPARGDNGRAADARTKPAKPYVVPPHLRGLPVMMDLANHVLQDPPGKNTELFFTTTDNSNTQFAILALWTAQRHGVPMQRSLQLMVRRFATSQNAQGAWEYLYKNGGGGASAPMTAVGLIGLAVGHGLANPDGGVKPVKDKRILNGLAALSRFIGQPAEQAANLPMQNLYFLWSVERAAVLYNLAKIGDKDWYRWGAQILIANQTPKGYWEKGQYPGNSPVLDTCLALLFLKRANLVSDLTSRLPFNSTELTTGVLDKITPPPAPPKPVEPAKTTATPPPEPAKPASPPETPVSKAPAAPAPTAPPTPASSPAPEEGSGKAKWVVLFAALFVVLAGGSAFFVILAVRKKNEPEERPRGKPSKNGKAKRKSKAPRGD